MLETLIFYYPAGGEALLSITFIIFLIVLRIKG
jgi:hypothetical protein